MKLTLLTLVTSLAFGGIRKKQRIPAAATRCQKNISSTVKERTRLLELDGQQYLLDEEKDRVWLRVPDEVNARQREVGVQTSERLYKYIEFRANGTLATPPNSAVNITSTNAPTETTGCFVYKCHTCGNKYVSKQDADGCGRQHTIVARRNEERLAREEIERERGMLEYLEARRQRAAKRNEARDVAPVPQSDGQESDDSALSDQESPFFCTGSCDNLCSDPIPDGADTQAWETVPGRPRRPSRRFDTVLVDGNNCLWRKWNMRDYKKLQYTHAEKSFLNKVASVLPANCVAEPGRIQVVFDGRPSDLQRLMARIMSERGIGVSWAEESAADTGATADDAIVARARNVGSGTLQIVTDDDELYKRVLEVVGKTATSVKRKAAETLMRELQFE